MYNPRHPHTAIIKRISHPDPFDASTTETVIYNGACRSFSRNVTTRIGEVITSYRVVSIPVKRGEWTVIPIEGDYIEITIGNLIEHGHIIDKNPHNLGTDLVWDYKRT